MIYRGSHFVNQLFVTGVVTSLEDTGVAELSHHTILFSEIHAYDFKSLFCYRCKCDFLQPLDRRKVYDFDLETLRWIVRCDNCLIIPNNGGPAVQRRHRPPSVGSAKQELLFLIIFWRNICFSVTKWICSPPYWPHDCLFRKMKPISPHGNLRTSVYISEETSRVTNDL